MISKEITRSSYLITICLHGLMLFIVLYDAIYNNIIRLILELRLGTEPFGIPLVYFLWSVVLLATIPLPFLCKQTLTVIDQSKHDISQDTLWRTMFVPISLFFHIGSILTQKDEHIPGKSKFFAGVFLVYILGLFIGWILFTRF